MRMLAQFVLRDLGRFGSLIAIGLLSITFMLTAVAAQQTHAAKPSNKSTALLVHGAFADLSSWNGVVDRLLARGYSVVAVGNALRGVQSDARYVTALLDSIPRPVVLVGHSCGGIVITSVSQVDAKVRALVYTAVLAPDLGESARSLSDKFSGSTVGPALAAAVALPEGGKDLYIHQS